MSERKIHNFKSEILRDMTIEKEGHVPESFGKTSNKFMYATCRVCGNPSRIRIGQYNKSGSACHKECRFKEQSLSSPFSIPEVREKAAQTNIKKYGHRQASCNSEISKKISETKNTNESKEKTTKTNMERYGVKNVFQNDEIKKIAKDTMIAKYGVEYALQSDLIKEKVKQTCIIKYGFTNPAMNDDVKKRAITTSQQKFGTDYPMQSAEVQEIAQNASMKKYKTKYPSSSPEVRSKIYDTNLHKYGSISPFGSAEIIQKARKTFFDRYGVENPSQIPEIRQKIDNMFIERFGIKCPITIEHLDQARQTCIEKYGVPYTFQNKEMHNEALDSLKYVIKENVDGKYDVINTLRYNDIFWDDLQKYSIKESCERNGIDYNRIGSALLREEFRQRYYDTYCFPKNQQQNEVKTFIDSILGKDKIILNTRSVISPLELDIYIPEKKLAIEFNGNYWHSEAILSSRSARAKHFQKTKACRDIDIRLVHIFQTTWKDRRLQVEAFLRNILGVNQNRIFARNCEISNSEEYNFLDNNHLQKTPLRVVCWFNLVDNDEIVASMTAGRHHRQNTDGNPIILSRFCSKANYNIVGGASKLFSKFIQWAKKEGYDRILSWSDNSYTNGDVYITLGFSMKNELPADYFYWDRKTGLYHSKQSQKKSLTKCPEEITENEWSKRNGLYRIWDCGKKLWEYKL